MNKPKTSPWLKGSLLVLSGLLFQQHLAQAKVTLPAVFSSHMVLQQKDKVPFHGTAAAGKTVTVSPSWNKKKYTTQADKNGNWQVTVPTPAAGRGFTISFNDGEELTLTNVAAGEVWVASGQSNMEMWPTGMFGDIRNAPQEIAAANYPDIRLLQVDKNSSFSPLKDAQVSTGGWQVCTPEAMQKFSAVAYFFGRELHKNLNVPIGIINTSWGGTIAEAWTSGSSLKSMPEFASKVEDIEKVASTGKTQETILADYQQAQLDFRKLINSKDAGYAQGRAAWAATDLNTSSWNQIKVPGLWENQGLPGFDGILWVRRTVTVPASWAGKELTISLGPVDDDEITFFNGEQVGATEGWDKPRLYKVPAHLVKAGENVVTVRVSDKENGGGIYGNAQEIYLANAAGEKEPLTGDWKYKPGVRLAELPAAPTNPLGPNQPTVLYNAMVYPFTSVPVKGVIWYQGESNAGRAYQYRTLFPTLINDWRKSWNRPALPFYFVQLANFMAPTSEPVDSDWAELREAQLMTLKLPHTGMAVAIDLGEEKDIHPKNKQDVGYRLALAALAQTYGKKIPFSGPLYQSMKTEGNSIRLTFQHTNGGLQAKDGKPLTGFAIAGADKKYYWADAKIVGNEVVVTSPKVPNPVAVRYGWANNPSVNLYNGAGLPASPFRTDTWPGLTVAAK
ncbi:sialate O-acetylesterase [Sabulibacter ruber]|uniref:sialate O-acetylesterase n=1 Tax=Sabulibacter ruber TaxID=2811901 RepID=UPI001A95DB3F|nr:sialate O-acetylesterase [Sabulibacter ruber]